jgi:hypothetical protein
MAGLLDIFGTGGTQALGLLGGGDIEGARNDAQAQALYALAGSLLSGGPTGMSIVKGLQQGQQAYRSAMRSELEDRMQQYQLQEFKRKKEEEKAAKQRKDLAQQILLKGYVPGQSAVEAPTPTGPISGEAFGEVSTPAVPAGYDFSKVAPMLMAGVAGQEGMDELLKRMTLQKAMTGDTTSLAEGATLVRTNPLTGKTETVVTGAPKGTTSMQEFLAAQSNPAYATFLREKESLKAPKIAVDLKDPTAVAKAQADVLKDWRSVVKDTGAMEVADRFKAAQQAVSAGNSGNKTADGALIYAIGKIYDPSGAVQEGDKQTILGNRSIPDSIKAYAQKAFSGQSLLPDERNGLLSVAKSIVETKAKNLEAQKAPYASISSQLGGNGSLLLNPLADVLTQQPTDLATQAAQILKQRRGGK